MGKFKVRSVPTRLVGTVQVVHFPNFPLILLFSVTNTRETSTCTTVVPPATMCVTFLRSLLTGCEAAATSVIAHNYYFISSWDV